MTHHNEWSASFNIPNRDKIHDIVAAFFCSHPKMEYTLERVERFRLVFRRGQWVRSSNGELRPAKDHEYSTKHYSLWPVSLRVLIQPTSDSLLITAKHDLVTPVSLRDTTHDYFAKVFAYEAAEFKKYMVDTTDTSNFPPGELKIETPAVELPKSDGQPNEALSSVSIAPDVTSPAVHASPDRAVHATSAAQSRYPSTKKSLSTWWPESAGGTAALVALLVATFFAAFARTGEPIEGIAGAAINYFIVIIIRYFAVVQPMNR